MLKIIPMKKSIKIFIYLILLINLSCAQDDPNTDCNNECDEVSVTEEISEVNAKVVLIENEEYNLNYKFLDIDPEFLDKEGYSTSNQTTLIPCELSDNYRDGMKVIVSGKKLDCCNIISLPSIRKSWGCKFEITSIEHLTD